MKYLLLIVGLLVLLFGIFGYNSRINYEYYLLDSLFEVRYLRQQSGTFDEEVWEESLAKQLESIGNLESNARNTSFLGIAIAGGSLLIKKSSKTRN